MKPLDLKSVAIGALAVIAGVHIAKSTKPGPCSFELEEQAHQKEKKTEEHKEET
jgi:hypothetical protein